MDPHDGLPKWTTLMDSQMDYLDGLPRWTTYMGYLINYPEKKKIYIYIDDIFLLWNVDKKEIKEFIVLANRHHPTIKFTAEISDKEINFLDTTVFKGERFNKQAILHFRTHFKPTETFQYTHFSSCHPPGVRKGFIKGEALRLLRTNSSAKSFVENINQFKACLRARDYPDSLVERITSEVKFSARKSALQQRQRVRSKILPFVTTFHPAV